MAPPKGQYFAAHALYKQRFRAAPDLSYRLVADELGCSKASVSEFFNKGYIPATLPDFLERLEQFLLDRGVIETPASSAPAKSKYWEDHEKMRKDQPTIERLALMPDVLDHFGLELDPFYEKGIPFMSKEFRRVEKSMLHCIERNIFTAVIGEVGAGKSTLLQSVKDHVADKMPHVIIAEVAPNDAQEIQAKHVRDAIMEAISGDGESPLTGSRQKRATHFRKHLESLREKGSVITVIIDDAQWLAPKMFGQLKLFSEMETGFRRLLGIVLIGQDPELDWRLAEIRSAGWRINRIRFRGLGDETRRYIEQRIRVAGGKAGDIMTPSALDRLCEIMRKKRLDFPLPISALMSLMLTKCVELGQPKVPKEMVDEFFTPVQMGVKETAKQRDMKRLSPALRGESRFAEENNHKGRKTA